jgi:hypothetical protein
VGSSAVYDIARRVRLLWTWDLLGMDIDHVFGRRQYCPERKGENGLYGLLRCMHLRSCSDGRSTVPFLYDL